MQWGSPNQNSVLEMNDTLFSKRCSHEHETAWEGDDIIAPKGHFRRTAAHDVVGFLSVLQGTSLDRHSLCCSEAQTGHCASRDGPTVEEGVGGGVEVQNKIIFCPGERPLGWSTRALRKPTPSKSTLPEI